MMRRRTTIEMWRKKWKKLCGGGGSSVGRTMVVVEGKHDGAVVAKKIKINREYYTVARKYEFYVRVARTISHE